MAFIGAVVRLYRALVIGLSLMHKACHLVERMNTKIQASNASTATKTAAANLVTAAQHVCDLIEADKADLADGQLGN